MKNLRVFLVNQIRNVSESYILILEDLIFFGSFNFFTILCFSEAWIDDFALVCEPLYKLPYCNGVHQLREHRKGGHNNKGGYNDASFNFKVRTDLSVNENDI